MKIGLISDIHANLRGLQAALEILDAQAVDSIICAGDLVGRGSQGNEVVELIRERQIPCVMGNHDYDAMEALDLDNTNENLRLFSEQTRRYLCQLPATLRYELEGLRVLVAHGTPESNMDYLFPKSPAIKYKLIAREAKADIIIFGHTHEPTYARFMGVWFFNPGSIYDDKSRGSHTCAVLTLPDCIYQVFNIGTGEPVNIPVIR